MEYELIKGGLIKGVYRIQSKDFRIYIGSSNNISERFRDHKARLRSGKHTNMYLQNYCNKHGIGSLSFDIIEIVNDSTEVTEIEQMYLTNLFTVFDNDYIFNLGRDAKAPMRGLKMKQEWIDKWKLSQTGVPKKEITRNRIALTNSGGKSYKLLSPAGIVYDNVINLREFSKVHGLEHTLLAHVTRGERKTHKGWKCTAVYYDRGMKEYD